ncbi:diguanylate cyclase (GGDEF) domain-containing protein [Marinobacter daqiaonensis]|uniref:Diguanylate cyclase (GGDEF) domain-containing protein n=1 Tax=Marinobacter daqiaonensis TaxID=650891 RepID=A0A1I6IJM9_9GAMM|nr:diguanylate cyclase [Marinobacter daqiaonensis]SFR66932.1 diguanylate cyclase (GGDEF) domain-containing protein [Marinobacter daqiaonensis]
MRAWFDRLANRGIAIFVAVIILTVAFVSMFNMAASRQELGQQARTQVAMVAELLAYELDRKLIERFNILTGAAATMTMDATSFRQFSGLIMERQSPYHHLFENLILFDEGGVVLEIYPEVEGLVGTDLSARPYFQDTNRGLTPVISEPFESYIRKLPTVAMTAPVFNHNGRVVGVFAGTIVLTSHNFLSEVANTRIGHDGYVGVGTRSGKMLVQGGRSAGFRDLSPGNDVAMAAMDGFEGVRTTTNRQGVEVMVAVQQLNMAPWFVLASWPLEDAFAPANRLREDLLLTIAIVLLILLPVAWYTFRRYTNPLIELAEQIRERHLGVRPEPVDVGGYREIRELEQAFNRVMADRNEVEARLRAEQEMGASILGVLHEAVVMTDTEGRIRYANRRAEEFLNRAGRLEGLVLFELLSFEAEGEEWGADRFLSSDEVHGMDGALRDEHDRVFDVEVTMLHVSRGEPDERLVFVVRDDSERRRQERHLSWQATHDSLTSLMNRRAFSAELVKWLAQARELEAPTVLMLIDLDHFKPVNDRGGHLTGDELLRGLAATLRQVVRKTDVIARLGGDEFAILLPACGLERALVLAEEIRRNIEALRVAADGQEFGVTASIGLSDLSPGDASPREAMARADEAAYAAKARGRNQVVVIASPLSD